MKSAKFAIVSFIVCLLTRAALSAPPETRRDNYLDLRAKHAARLRSEETKREAQKRAAGAGVVVVEDQYEIAFERWDRYWRDHLDAGARVPGKMADMTRHLRAYAEGARGLRKTGTGTLSTAQACPTGGMGNWTSLGPSTYPAPVMGKVTSVFIDGNNPSTAYAGAAEGGLFKTVNNGASWINLTDPSRYPALGVGSIVVHPTIPTTLYLATHNGPPGGGVYGFGILKSVDGGVTWQEIFTLATYNNQTNYNVSEGSRVQKIMLHPQDPNTIYALAAHYVFRSTDAGVTWQKVMEITLPVQNPDGCGYRPVDIDIIAGQTGVSDSAVLVTTVRTAWLGLPNSPCGTAKAFLSTAGGANNTFTDITSAVLGTDLTDRLGGAVQPGNNAEFFIGFQNLATGSFVLKKHSIATNTPAPVGTVTANGVFQLGAGFWDLEMDFSRLDANTLYVAGTTAYRIRLAGGFSAAQISSYWATGTYGNALAKTHGDVRAMSVVRSGTKDVVLLGTDGGIHKAILDPALSYTTTTANWQDLTGPGLAINEFFDINGIESNADVLFGGTQDNGTFVYNNGSWAQGVNYDGWRGTMNQTTGQYFGMSNAGGVKGTPGALGFVSAPGIGGGPVVSDPNNPSVIYGGGASVYKSTNFGTTWTTLPAPPGTQNMRVIQVAPSNSNVLYVAREGQTWDPNDFSKHLFKSVNGGSTWTDIGVNLPPLTWAGVSDIAVDPNDPNRVWIAFNGYWPMSSTSTDGVNRVWFSADGGNTFSDFTFNLPAFPTLALVYQSGSDDALYLGNDVGVFRYDKALNAWTCFSGGPLPVAPVTALVFNSCKNKLRAATAGRGIYESDVPLLPSQVLTASATWSGVRYLPNDLTIAPGATLTLTGTLNMSRDRHVIVQRGATLIVNGGKITNCCGDMWHGIDVWGTASAPQNLAGAQGKLIVQNNAVIENAREAIVTGRDVNGTFDWNYTGAIVRCENSSFRNNRRSAEFMYYHWMNGANELPNQSRFVNCTFETNRLLNDPTTLPDAHVSLYEVKGVAFAGCKFSNTAPLSAFDVNHRGNGLASADSDYRVDDLFNSISSLGSPPSVLAPSTFTGLTFGVLASFTAGVNKKVAVANSDFTDVQRGVQITNSQSSSVTGNNFNALPNAQTANFADATWGVRMNGATPFLVSGNTVTGANASYQNDYGIIIDGGGASPANVVSRNTLKDLYTGIQALGNNGTGSNGVQFRCNVFQTAMMYQLAVQPSGTLADQGVPGCTLGGTVDNTFFAQASPVGSQINAPGVTFNYFASGIVPTNIAGPVTVTTCSAVSGECNIGNPNVINMRTQRTN
jgi:hypothetical protein